LQSALSRIIPLRSFLILSKVSLSELLDNIFVLLRISIILFSAQAHMSGVANVPLFNYAKIKLLSNYYFQLSISNI
jgi:hypothetical protein